MQVTLNAVHPTCAGSFQNPYNVSMGTGVTYRAHDLCVEKQPRGGYARAEGKICVQIHCVVGRYSLHMMKLQAK